MITFTVVTSSLSSGHDVAIELNGDTLSKTNTVSLTDGEYLALKENDRIALYTAMSDGYVLAENELGAALTAANVLAGSLGVVNLTLNGVEVFDDEAATLTFGSTKQNCLWNTALTAARAVALSTVGAVEGCKFKITRSAVDAGGFALNVGTGPLKAMPANSFCEVTFDGTAWVLTKFGLL